MAENYCLQLSNSNVCKCREGAQARIGVSCCLCQLSSSIESSDDPSLRRVREDQQRTSSLDIRRPHFYKIILSGEMLLSRLACTDCAPIPHSRISRSGGPPSPLTQPLKGASRRHADLASRPAGHDVSESDTEPRMTSLIEFMHCIINSSVLCGAFRCCISLQKHVQSSHLQLCLDNFYFHSLFDSYQTRINVWHYI